MELPLVVTFLSALPFIATTQVRNITCSCTTTHCRESGVRTCNTTGLCFSQYLDRRDGSDPLVRGCIGSRTPLLCENRRPAVPQHRDWPVLICCGENMCNARVVPTLPPIPTPQTSTEYVTTSEDTTDVPSSTQQTTNFRDKVYLAMFLVGIFAVISIVVVAIFLARRQSTSYDPEFGRVSTNGYVKGCCDPPSVVADKGLENKFALDT